MVPSNACQTIPKFTYCTPIIQSGYITAIVHNLCNKTFKFEPKNRRDERFLKIKNFKCIFRLLSVKFAIMPIFPDNTN